MDGSEAIVNIRITVLVPRVNTEVFVVITEILTRVSVRQDGLVAPVVIGTIVRILLVNITELAIMVNNLQHASALQDG